jgi:MerR family mercuric resistance operon transcriptional regulator
MRIGEVARVTGISVDTLRYYERLGLLPAAARSDGGMRRYSGDVVNRVRFIKQSQTLGLTLREVRQLVSVTTTRRGRAACERVRDVLVEHVENADRQIAELRSLRRTLARHLAACEKALARPGEPTCPTLNVLDGTAKSQMHHETR